jgi:hypothetical protein
MLRTSLALLVALTVVPAHAETESRQALRLAIARLRQDPALAHIVATGQQAVSAPVKIRQLDGEGYYFRVPILLPGGRGMGFRLRQVAWMDVVKRNGDLMIWRLSLRLKPGGDPAQLELDTLELRDVVGMAVTFAGEGTTALGGARLVYDGAETRVGWLVEVELSGGKRARVMVTPRFQYFVK